MLLKYDDIIEVTWNSSAGTRTYVGEFLGITASPDGDARLGIGWKNEGGTADAVRLSAIEDVKYLGAYPPGTYEWDNESAPTPPDSDE
jgi:hypothetical protein